MLFASLTHLPTAPLSTEGVELRLDLFEWNFEELSSFVKRSSTPLLLTLRKADRSQIEQLLSLSPTYLDLELSAPYPRFDTTTKIILSYHNFDETPSDEVLEKLVERGLSTSAYGIKIATLAKTTSDALRLLLLARRHPKVSGIAMGEVGSFARVLAPVVGNLFNYAPIGSNKTAPGQIPLDELVSIYRYPKLTQETKLYGLIGSPVAQSLGHLYHNGAFERDGVNGVYVKMEVQEGELSTFFSLAKQLPFEGLSVTMPLKEKVLPYIDHLDPKAKRCGAVNTLRFRGGLVEGFNTDGVGALDALEQREKVRGKRVVLWGAGGAARAIASEALERGAEVWLLGRTREKAVRIAEELGCLGGSLEEIPGEYDVLVQCSPDGAAFDERKLVPGALLMDLVYVPRITPFLERALKRGCEIVSGEEMFFAQAEGQRRIWGVG